MFSDAKRIVVKVGTSTLTHATGQINIRLMEQLVKVLADIKNSGKQVVLVTSGAIAVGVGKLGLPGKPADIPGKQATAAVGQCELMYLYDKYFSEYNHTVGQVLLTRYTMDNPDGRQNAKNTFEALLAMGAIPVVNENDTVATDEIRVGDNDTLSAMVAKLIEADTLILLSDIDGLYTANPQVDPTATLVPLVEELTEQLMETAGGAGTSRGTGGMVTKLVAAQLVTSEGIDMYIMNGKNPGKLYDLMDGVPVGTRFIGRKA